MAALLVCFGCFAPAGPVSGAVADADVDRLRGGLEGRFRLEGESRAGLVLVARDLDPRHARQVVLGLRRDNEAAFLRGSGRDDARGRATRRSERGLLHERGGLVEDDVVLERLRVAVE